MEKTPSPSVTDTELSILTVLWDRGPVPVRDIVDQVYGTRSASIHATVNSLLERLEGKGYVGRDRSGHAHLYHAIVDRQSFVGQQLQQLAEKHFGGSVTPMLLALVDQARLKKSVRDEIRKMIADLK
jgi:BlaI family transcriptional regulator, penicillinase repressor